METIQQLILEIFLYLPLFEVLSNIKTNADLKCQAIRELSKTIKQTVKGQSVEILSRSDFNLKMHDYESTAKAKTGGLICLPVKLSLSFQELN